MPGSVIVPPGLPPAAVVVPPSNRPGAVGVETVGGAVDVHEAETDPHPQYLTQARGDDRYALAGSAGGGGLQQVFVQATQPATVPGEPWVWWRTINGALSDYYVWDGVA